MVEQCYLVCKRRLVKFFAVYSQIVPYNLGFIKHVKATYSDLSTQSSLQGAVTFTTVHCGHHKHNILKENYKIEHFSTTNNCSEDIL